MERINDVDVSLINDRAFDTVRRVNGENIDAVSRNIDSSNRYYDHVSAEATRRAFSTNAAASRLLYHKNTDLIAQMNESWNKNRHFNLTLKNESERLSKGNKTAAVDVYKMRQEELQLEYSRHYAKVMTKIMLLTILSIALITIVVALFRMGKIKKMLVVILAVVIVFYYTISVLSQLGGLARRRALDWERYYWQSKLAGEPKECNA
jgi:hypothetical protein